MAYQKTTWADGQTPAINSTNLNHIEQGIYDVDQAISGISVPEVKTTNTTSDTATYSCTYTNTALGNKLNTSAVKTSKTTSDSDTYSCTYVNSKIKTSRTTSDNDTYSCTYVNNWNGAYDNSNNSNLKYGYQGEIQCKPKNLYNDSTGTTGTVNLSETSANFNYLEIFYYAKIANTNYYNSVKVYSPNGKKAVLISANAISTAMVLSINIRSISGTSITSDYNGTYSSFGAPGGTNEVYICRVDGYK